MASRRPEGDTSSKSLGATPDIPQIQDDDSFAELVRKLSLCVRTQLFLWIMLNDNISFFVEAVQTPHSFEELRTNPHGRNLKPLIRHLADNVSNRAIVAAVLSVYGRGLTVFSTNTSAAHSKATSLPLKQMTIEVSTKHVATPVKSWPGDSLLVCLIEKP
jgi:hypothetical protein